MGSMAAAQLPAPAAGRRAGRQPAPVPPSEARLRACVTGRAEGRETPRGPGQPLRRGPRAGGVPMPSRGSSQSRWPWRTRAGGCARGRAAVAYGPSAASRVPGSAGPSPPCAGALGLPLLFLPQLQQGQEQGCSAGERGAVRALSNVSAVWPCPRALRAPPGSAPARPRAQTCPRSGEEGQSPPSRLACGAGACSACWAPEGRGGGRGDLQPRRVGAGPGAGVPGGGGVPGPPPPVTHSAPLQQKYVRCSVRAQIRHLRRVLCHRLGLALQHVQILFNNEVLPDHMTMKQLWLSRWFGKPAPLLLHYSIKDKRR
uniref:Polycomb group ring finger 1 n=1 Tax=Apteryx owenii TaxID=8824 RepID=A0A8B9QPP8_APTOW